MTPDRILTLAVERAKQQHEDQWGRRGVFGETVSLLGHEERPFELCPHPDCALVRPGGVPQFETEDRDGKKSPIRDTGTRDAGQNQDGPHGGTNGAARGGSDQSDGASGFYTDDDIDAGIGAIYNTTRLPNIQAIELARHVRQLIEASRTERLARPGGVETPPAEFTSGSNHSPVSGAAARTAARFGTARANPDKHAAEQVKTATKVPGEMPVSGWPPVQLQDGKSPEWTCPECGEDLLFCGHKSDPAARGAVEPPAQEPPTMADAAEMLWVVLANVSGGDWTKQSQEWQDAAARWRDNYFEALRSARSTPPPAERDDISLRYCICADPENCREPVEGYVCRKGHVPTPSSATDTYCYLIERDSEDGGLPTYWSGERGRLNGVEITTTRNAWEACWFVRRSDALCAGSQVFGTDFTSQGWRVVEHGFAGTSASIPPPERPQEETHLTEMCACGHPFNEHWLDRGGAAWDGCYRCKCDNFRPSAPHGASK
jgi:hypothetical protein